MKSIRLFINLICIFLVGLLFSCNGEPAPSETKKYLFHPPEEELELTGSVLEVDGGILVLVQSGSLKEIPTIIIPANDSAATAMKEAYRIRTENQYQGSLKPWVKLTGTFIREDSLKPIFKYNYVSVPDQESEQQQVEEMEE